jgi:hypothetical protein
MVSKSNKHSRTNEIIKLINPETSQDEVIWPESVSFSKT